MQDVARVLKSKEDALACRVAELESIVCEWSDIFASPSSALVAAGVTRSTSSPAFLARRLLELDAARASAESRANSARVAGEREAADLRSALRDAGRVSREQAAHELSSLKQAADGAVARERAARASAEETLAKTRATMASDVANEVRLGVAAATHDLRLATEAARADAAAAIAAANRSRNEALERAKTAETMLAAERSMAAQAATRAEESAAAAAAKADAAVCAAREEALSAVRERDDIDAAWRQRWLATNSAWENSASSLRVSTLENQCAFLTCRVRELQTLCDAMQIALAGSHGASAAPAAGAEPTPDAATLREERKVGTRGARPWQGRSFGNVPALVRHAGAAGDGLSFAAGPAPVATAYAWVR